MIYASIDIGTNTLRLLIAELPEPTTGKGELKPLEYTRRITRLGGGYTKEGGIARDAADRTLEGLSEFAREIKGRKVKRVRAVATSVVRRAVNGPELIRDILEKTGLEVSVITGEEEARLSLLGALCVVQQRDGQKSGQKKRILIDIGGGSTEFVLATGAELTRSWSIPMGVVHLSEAHLNSDPPLGSELSAMEGEICGTVNDLTTSIKDAGINLENYSQKSSAELVGTAGTVTSLAALELGLKDYDRDQVNNYILSRENTQAAYARLSGFTLAERGRLAPLEKGREDLIIPGAAIVLQVMVSFGFNNLTVSDAGLLEGIIIDRFNPGQP